MAVPSYTTDLATFDLLETAPNMGEFSGLTGGRSETIDSDFPIQNTNHLSKQYNATGLGSLGVDFGAGVAWTTGFNFFMWGVFLPAGAVDTYANGGIRMIVGETLSDHRQWIVGGNNDGSYPYGGWQNFVVDPETAGDYTDTGTYSAVYQWVGMGVNVLTSISKGNPFGIDAIRYGRGELKVNGGQAADYANFAGLAVKNDDNLNMWGLFQAIPGGYLWKGLITLGSVSAVDFRDSNKSITIDNTRKVLSSFNRIEIKTTATNIDWANISITALGTVSKGELEVIDDVAVNMTSCVFTDMSTFIFQSLSDINGGTVFRRCGAITQGGAHFDGALITASTATYALDSDDPDLLDNVSFEDNATALYIPASVTGSVTLDGCLFSGNTVDIYWAGTVGTLTVNKVNGSNPITTASAGGTVSIVASVSINIHVQDQAKADIATAYVYINDDDAGTAEVNTTTDANGDVSTSYAGAVDAATLRIRKYGYKPFKDTVSLASDINRTITLITDPQQV